jgi:hypothetical protein
MPDDTPAEGQPVPAPAPGGREVTLNAGKAWGYAKDFLVVLVIPLLLWGVKLEVGNAERDLRIEQLSREIEDLKDEVSEAQDIDKSVQANALKLATLEGKLDTANGRLSEITTLLRDH